jgi:voltage-gated potassium channel Kch
VVQSSRQSGLSAVYSELLDFDGSEIYVTAEPALLGKSFGDALMAYDTSTVIGVCHIDGHVELNPEMATTIVDGMKLILIAEDDSTIRLSGKIADIDSAAIIAAVPRPRLPERTLVLGWNRRGPMIALELSRFAAPGSALTIAADTPGLAEEVAALELAGTNLAVRFQAIDTAHRGTLEGLDVPSYDHVLVLDYSDHLGPQQTDTRTLLTLLHLRKITEAAGVHVSVVSEMIDVRNRELAEVTRADDFVVSNRLVSLMLAQASENEYLAAIFADLLDEAGSEIYMRPAADYVATGRPVDFYTVSEAARRRGEVAIGYSRPRAGMADERKMGGVVVNPPKSVALSYEAQDRVVVLARD